KPDTGVAVCGRDDFDFAPVYTRAVLDAHAKQLADRFFGGKARGERSDPPRAVSNLAVGIDLAGKAVTVTGERRADALNLDEVNAGAEHCWSPIWELRYSCEASSVAADAFWTAANSSGSARSCAGMPLGRPMPRYSKPYARISAGS